MAYALDEPFSRHVTPPAKGLANIRQYLIARPVAEKVENRQNKPRFLKISHVRFYLSLIQV
jgi:hypothetical protein